VLDTLKTGLRDLGDTRYKTHSTIGRGTLLVPQSRRYGIPNTQPTEWDVPELRVRTYLSQRRVRMKFGGWRKRLAAIGVVVAISATPL
jgi:hypothetical protein